MRKSLMFIFLAAGSAITGGSVACFAADAAASTGAAAAVQPSQREMHRMQQNSSEGQGASDATEDQSTGDDHAKGSDQQQNEDQNQDESKDQPKAEAAADNSSSFAVPAPSQRAMRQQLRDARQNQAPAAGNQ